MKRVLYVATSPAHKRALEAFHERLDMTQAVAGPGNRDEYENFGLQDIYTYANKKELQAIVNKYKPDVYVEASLPCANGITLPRGCKKVYVSHGLVGNHVKGMIKPAGLNTSVWKGCDLYCGAWDSVFTEWIKHAAKVDDDKILLNALPQLDILHEGVDSNRDAMLKRDFPEKYKSDSKAIAFFGFCCKDRFDFVKHNDDYFSTAIHLSKISKQADFLTYIKPRQEKSKLIGYLKRKAKTQVQKDYESIYKNRERVCFVGPMQNHVLDYYFVDAFVTNGCSTVEIEACALGKPLFVVRTQQGLQEGYDPYDTVKSGAAIEVRDLKELEMRLRESIRWGRHHNPDKQKQLLADMGISFDGHHCERIQDRIARL